MADLPFDTLPFQKRIYHTHKIKKPKNLLLLHSDWSAKTTNRNLINNAFRILSALLADVAFDKNKPIVLKI